MHKGFYHISLNILEKNGVGFEAAEKNDLESPICAMISVETVAVISGFNLSLFTPQVLYCLNASSVITAGGACFLFLRDSSICDRIVSLMSPFKVFTGCEECVKIVNLKPTPSQTGISLAITN